MTAERSLTRGSLERLVGHTASNDDDQRRLGAAAWHQRNFYSEHIDDMDDDPWFQQAAINRANRRFGKRTTGPNATKDAQR